MRALIIEDEPKVRRALKRLLLEIDPEIEAIREAETGGEGLEAIQAEMPDLILLDMIMPGMNGNEVLERIRVMKLEMPVIVVSGHHDFEFVKQALLNEAVDYILKPFDRDDVEAALLKAKERIDRNGFRQQTARLWQEMKKERSQLHRASVLKNLYEGRNPAKDELGLLPEFAWNQACRVHTIVVKNFEQALRERFNKDKELLAYAIGKLFEEYAEKEGTELIFAPSGRCDGCYWLIAPSTTPSTAVLKGLLVALEKVLKLHCFAMSSEEIDAIADYSPTIAALEGAAFYADLRSLERDPLNGWESRKVATPELLAFVTAFIPKVSHLIKHRLSFRIRGELEELFEAASASRCLSAMFLFQTWTTIRTRVETEFGFKTPSSGLLDRIEPFALRIAFDETKAMELFADSLNGFMTAANAGPEAKNQENRALAIKEYIDLCYRDPMSLADLAQRFFISKEYLASQFKRQFGVTVVQYIHIRRLETAREMLEGNEWTVSAIASAVGFDHFSYFDKLFKRQYGSTPSEYRTLHAEGKVH